MEIHPKRRLTALVLGEQTVRRIECSKVLVVGAGGIGCELVKNLAKSGCKTMTILDFDNIEITNLNRQFYFRKDHIGLSKAQTVKSVLLSMDSSLKITAINASIYDNKFNMHFYEQFDLIFSCLDNMKARQHLAAQATKYNKPLIDAGTMSYNGQAYASIRFLNSCHNCNPSHSEQTHAYCTIRSHPQLPVHCATYAKNFYDSFFGVNHAQALSDQLKFNKYFPQAKSEASREQLSAIADKLFQQMFNIGINDVDLQGNKIQIVRKLTADQARLMTQVVINPHKSTFVELQHNNQLRSPYKQEKLWSIADYFAKFKESTINLLNRKLKNESPASFEKDDEDCMNLILCITNLRTYNFINYDTPHNKHKYLTFYQCKDLIGKVFPAIASTNAIAAALQARQAVNILSNSLDKLRYISFGSRGDERISPSFQGSPNFQCNFCSEKIIYGRVACDMTKITFKDLQQFAAQNYFTRNRQVSCGALSIIRSSRPSSLANRDKLLNSFPEMISNGILELKFTPQMLQPQYQVYLSIIHCEQQQGIARKDGSSRRKAYQQLLRYFRKSRSEYVSNYAYELELNGGYEL